MDPGSSIPLTRRRYLASASWLITALMFVGCASPGPPRAPSLQLPGPVRDLTATREGDAVTVRFTLPQRTTDNLPIREGAVQASLCFGPEASPCTILPSLHNITLKLTPQAAGAEASVASPSAIARTIAWTDTLPSPDTTGAPKLLAFRVELSNLRGKTAGWSDPAYTASGAAPPPVQGLQAQETPSGILLRWQPAPSPAASSAANTAEVLLQRESLAPPNPKKPAQAQPIWLATHAQTTGPEANETLDTSAAEDIPYRYTAVRRQILQLGQQKVELRSAISPAVEITWRNLFPPPAPTELSAAPFIESSGFAVDLVWEPVEEPGLEGYIVTRQRIDAGGAALGPTQRLTPTPVPLPAFHDASAEPTARYQYSVTAVGHKGTQSPPATVIIEPPTQ